MAGKRERNGSPARDLRTALVSETLSERSKSSRRGRYRAEWSFRCSGAAPANLNIAEGAARAPFRFSVE